MEKVIIEPKTDTPGVTLDFEKGFFEFAGKSLPHDVTVVYNKIIDLLNEYAKSPKELSELHLKFDYFNTASSKKILDIMLIFEKMQAEGNKCLIHWYYDPADEDMEIAGKEYSELIEVEFKMYQVKA